MPMKRLTSEAVLNQGGFDSSSFLGGDHNIKAKTELLAPKVFPDSLGRSY